MVLLFIVLTVISGALFRSSRRAWLTWGGILLLGFLILRRPISDFTDPIFIGSIPNLSVVEVLSAREFTVTGWAYLDRRIVLAGTRLPATKAGQDAAKLELLKSLGGKKRVTISFPRTVRHTPEPWPAIVNSSGVSLNIRMLASGALLSDGMPLSSTFTISGLLPAQKVIEPHVKKPGQSGQGTKSGKLPTWLRYVIWIFAGFFGATSLGMVINKRPMGLTFLLLIAGSAIRSIIISFKSGATVWPPIICLIITVLFGGAGVKASEEFLEGHPDLRK